MHSNSTGTRRRAGLALRTVTGREGPLRLPRLRAETAAREAVRRDVFGPAVLAQGVALGGLDAGAREDVVEIVE